MYRLRAAVHWEEVNKGVGKRREKKPSSVGAFAPKACNARGPRFDMQPRLELILTRELLRDLFVYSVSYYRTAIITKYVIRAFRRSDAFAVGKAGALVRCHVDARLQYRTARG